MNKVTVTETLAIDATPEAVWEFTQDWRRRHEWDRSVLSAEYLTTTSPVSLKVHGAGGLTFKVTYKLSDHPRLTTLIMTDMSSFWLKGGGGSWKYESRNGKTCWTQHNTLVLRDGLLGMMFRPLFTLILTVTTRQLMKRARQRIESRL